MAVIKNSSTMLLSVMALMALCTTLPSCHAMDGANRCVSIGRAALWMCVVSTARTGASIGKEPSVMVLLTSVAANTMVRDEPTFVLVKEFILQFLPATDYPVIMINVIDFDVYDPINLPARLMANIFLQNK
uniref:Dirigent protein n=1 Tax=Oryza barthii TaxID=65489 RepID=A0A0D3HJ17_9ORYZ